MNALFWLIVALMLLVAIMLLVLPLWRAAAAVSAGDDLANIDLARQRLGELKQQLRSGELDQSQFDAQYHELQRLLRDDLQSSRDEDGPMRNGRWIAPLVAIGLPTLSLFLYLWLGDINALQKVEFQRNAEQVSGNVEAMLAKLRDRLAQHPEDAEGWRMLGRSYSFLQQYPQATEAFAQRLRLVPDDAESMLEYADALAMSRNGQLSGEPARWIYQALALVPQNSNALWLAALAKAEEGDSVQALSYLQTLEKQLPDNADSLKQVRQLLAKLQETTSAKAVSIPIQVAIEPTMREALHAGDVLFVYAQAIEGPKMPLAIVRKQAADLPLTLELSDAQALQPGTHLADFERIKIVARVSASGDAKPQSGDLLGVAEIKLPLDNPPVTLLINQRVN